MIYVIILIAFIVMGLILREQYNRIKWLELVIQCHYDEHRQSIVYIQKKVGLQL